MSATSLAGRPVARAAEPTEPPRRPSRLLGEPSLYAAAAGLTSVLTALALRLWHAALTVPLTYSGDALGVGAHVKTVLDTGWYEHQPALGAPFGQMYHDFPQADNLHLAVVAAMNPFVDRWPVAMNLYYLLGFPLAAVTAVWFLRLVGVSRALALVLAVLYALAPYHFERNQGHLFLASYYPVPLAAGIVVQALRRQPLWGRRRGDRRAVLAWLTGPAALTILAMVLVGSASTYYSIFTLVLLGTAGLAALWRDRSWRRFAGTAAAGAVLVATVLANMAPDLLWSRGRDPNTLIVTREPGGAEVYGLKLAQLLLPSAHHRWAPLRELRRTYDRTFPLPGESPALGVVAAAGLVLLLVVIVSSLAVRPSAPARTRTTLRHLALLTLASLLAATIGGASTLFALLVTDNVRGWNRMSIFISLFCLAAVGLALDGFSRWARATRRGSHPLGALLPALLAVGVLGVGLVDQTGPLDVPKYAAVRAAYTSDRTYVRAIEEQLPPQAAVYQMPYQVFPESAPVNGVLDTEQLRLFLVSTDTRWSAGGLKGRPQADWPLRLADEPTSAAVRLLAIAGFSGLSLDRKALGPASPQVEADVVAEVGGPPTATSPDDRFAFWPLAAVRQEMERRHDDAERATLRQATLLPPMLYAPDLDEPVAQGGTNVRHSRTADPELLLDNARTTPIRAHLSFAVTSPRGASGVQVRLPGREPMSLDLTRGPAPVEVDLELPPGRSHVRLRLLPGTRAPAADPDAPASAAPVAMFDLIGLDLEEPILSAIAP